MLRMVPSLGLFQMSPIFLPLIILLLKRMRLCHIPKDKDTLGQSQAIPGQIGLEHRIGGLEKGEDGGVSYDPENHEEMSLLRAKVAGISKLEPIEIW